VRDGPELGCLVSFVVIAAWSRTARCGSVPIGLLGLLVLVRCSCRSAARAGRLVGWSAGRLVGWQRAYAFGCFA